MGTLSMKVLVVLVSVVACAAAQNVVCGKGSSTNKEVTVEDKKTYTFKTQKGKKYPGNTECTVKYKMGDSCAKMSFVCNKFNTNNKDKKKCTKGDKLTVTANGKPKAYCKTKKPKVSSTGDISVVFTSDKKKSGSGAICKVKCTEAVGSGTGFPRCFFAMDHDEEKPVYPTCSPGVACPPLVKCPHVTTSLTSTWTPCTLPGNYPGVCCPQPTGADHQGTHQYEFKIPLKYGFGGITQFQTFGPELPKAPVPLNVSVPSDLLAKHQESDKTAVEMNAMAHTLLREKSCYHPPVINCSQHQLYRTCDGTCNNIDHPYQGASHQPYRRLLSPSYGDGVSSVRSRSVTGAPLPSARVVADKVLTRQDGEDHGQLSVHVMQWGQFLTHDLDHTPVVSAGGDKSWDCCGQHRNRSECAPIEISEEDSFYGPEMKVCMSFVRSSWAPSTDCKNWAEQINQITSYVDGSMVYGSGEKLAREIREWRGGRLHMEMGKILANSPSSECHIPETAMKHCFMSGDKRTNEQPGLALYHILWHREHNRVADSLQSLNPHWDDERLYQEARVIVIGEIQHITYNEYLPLLLPTSLLTSLSILPTHQTHSTLSYSPEISAHVSNAFATAALRFGHTMVPNNFSLASTTCPRQELMSEMLDKLFFNPLVLHSPRHLTECISSLSSKACPPPRSGLSTSLMGKLFHNRNDTSSVGLDLASINIQRGRDHGLPGYTRFRALCGGGKVERFSDLSSVMKKSNIKSLRSAYQNVADIDLFVGGLMERKLAGGLLGPTFSCIIADQMFRSMFGDRFFYSLTNTSHPLGPEMIAEIKNSNLAAMLCDNSNVGTMQPAAFRTVSYRNPLVSCKSKAIPRINLLPWKESGPHQPLTSSISKQAPDKNNQRSINMRTKQHSPPQPHQQPSFGSFSQDLSWIV